MQIYTGIPSIVLQYIIIIYPDEIEQLHSKFFKIYAINFKLSVKYFS